MTAPEELEARRERAVHRAITRAVERPAPAELALIGMLRDLPREAFDTSLADIQHAPGAPHSWIDGVQVQDTEAAVQVLQDRYGLTRADARTLLHGDSGPAGYAGVRRIGGGA